MASGIVETTSQQQQQQQQQQEQSSAVSKTRLVQRLLAASNNLPQFVNDLVTTQAVVVAGSEAAGFAIERGGEDAFNLRPIAHVRPDNSDAQTRAAAIAAFQEILRPCVVQEKDGAIRIGSPDEGTDPQFCLVTLLRNEGSIVAVSAVITRCRDDERARQRLMSMQLVAGYFDLFTLRRAAEQTQLVAQSHQHVLQLANAVATSEGFDAAGMNLCNELASRTGAARVSLGWMKGRYIRVKALSHTEKFDKKQELIVQLERVMEECLDQEEPVRFDPTGESSQNVNRAARELSRAHGGHTVLSLPLRRRAEIEGVITLEFPPEHTLSEQAAAGLAVAVDLLAPQLYDRYQNDRWLITKAGISTRDVARLAVGPRHMLAKLIISVLLAAGLFVTLYSPMYNVKAPFQFAAVDKRTIAAPFDGYIDSLGDIGGVEVRPGTRVNKGDVLLMLDTHPLELQWTEAMSQANAHERQAARYRNDRNRETLAEAQIEEHRRDAALAQAEHLAWQIEQAKIVAPIDGVILRGDHLDRKGAPVRVGDVLFEIGETDSLRAELLVSERDVQRLEAGQNGRLATSTLPGDKRPFKVERIVPMGEARDGNNVFKVYAQLLEEDPHWLPGMMGEARVEVGHRRLIWIWTHSLVDWLRLKLWM